VQALVFGPGLPTAGARGTLVVGDAAFEVRVDAVNSVAGADGAGFVSRSIPAAEAELREVGFGRPGLELAWIEGGERWAAHVLDPEAAARILASPAFARGPQALALQTSRRRRAAGRTLGWSVVAGFVLFPLLLLAAVVLQADRLAAWATHRVPVETETRLGRAAFEDLRTQLDLQTSGPAYEAVQALGQRLTQGSKYRYEFHVARDAAVNAFALPGGIVVVHTGLIAATKRPEELAGVLAHEVQHVELRHSLEGVAKELGLRAAWLLVTGDVGGTLASEAALQLTGLRFSREAEEEADAAGFALLVERGIDPSGMQAFFATLEATSGGEPPAFLSTHPASAERARALEAKLATLDGRQFEPLPQAGWPPE
jgi:Zn-dependent protease with chaperone function